MSRLNVIDRAFSDMLSQKRSDATGTAGSGGSFFDLFPFGNGSVKGARAVNYKQSLKLSAVYNAVDMKSDSLGIIPFGVYQKTKEGRERRASHPVDWILNEEPDGPQGHLIPFHWRKLIGVSLMLRGNCLFRIKSKGDGTQYLKYIAWDDVYDIRKIVQDNGDVQLVYMTKDGNLLPNEVLHYKILSLDGIVGVSTITYACLNLGLALEIQEFSYTAFQNKGVLKGVIETDKVLSEAGAKGKIIAGWNSSMQEKSPDRIVVLDEGFKFKPIMITPQEAQIIESSRFSIEDIARWFNMPLHKIKSMQQSTNNNIEQQSLDYSTDSVQPLVTAMEQEEKRKLFTRDERKNGYYIKGNMNVLLRADMKSRGEFYSKMVNGGIYLANEVRALEDMNDLEGGTELRIPVNTKTQSQIDEEEQNNKGNE